MSTTQTVLITSTVFLFIMGAWPIAFITAIAFIIVSVIKAHKKGQGQNTLLSDIEQLKAENQQLRQELKQLQTVQRAMDRAESRERKD